jgi:hypothetical protein
LDQQHFNSDYLILKTRPNNNHHIRRLPFSGPVHGRARHPASYTDTTYNVQHNRYYNEIVNSSYTPIFSG